MDCIKRTRDKTRIIQYITHTIVQTSKLATWQKKKLIYSPAGMLVRHIVK